MRLTRRHGAPLRDHQIWKARGVAVVGGLLTAGAFLFNAVEYFDIDIGFTAAAGARRRGDDRLAPSAGSRRLQEIDDVIIGKYDTNGNLDWDDGEYVNAPAERKVGIIVHIIGALYMLIGLNTVCDIYFCGALDEMVEKWNVKPDVAGATFMAAGGSAPELFTSLIGAVITENDVGFGTIVGSAVFNVLAVIGCCGLSASEPIHLTWWPLFRDCTFYVFGLTLLALFASGETKTTGGVQVAGIEMGAVREGGGEIELWEAIVLFSAYLLYCVLMWFNEALESRVQSFLDRIKGRPVASKVSPEPDEQTQEPPLENSSEGDKKLSQGFESSANADGQIVLPPMVVAIKAPDVVGAAQDNLREGAYGETAPGPPEPPHTVFKLPSDEPPLMQSFEGDGAIAATQVSTEKSASVPSSCTDAEVLTAKSSQCHGEKPASVPVCTFAEVAASKSCQLHGGHHRSTAGTHYDHGTDWAMRRVHHHSHKVHHHHHTHPDFHRGSMQSSKSISSLDRAEGGSASAPIRNSQASLSVQKIATLKSEPGTGEAEEEQAEQDGDDVSEESEDDAAAMMLRPEECTDRALWYFSLPIYALLYYTVPKPSPKWFLATFGIALIHIAHFSYWLVFVVERFGQTFGINTIVMSFTVLAAGTSIPDLVSSMAVARAGEGDMAVSSSIGSNIFDILVGLPIPWIIKIGIVEKAVNKNTDYVVQIKSPYITLYVVLLLFMVALVIISIHLIGWKLNKGLGVMMAALYVVFLCIVLPVEMLRPEIM